MAEHTPDPADRIAAIQAVWSAGSYTAVGDMWAGIGQELADELAVRFGLEGRDVLDAACGTGNTTLALARAGARVAGMDLTPDLLAVAAGRAELSGLEIEWREGDLVDMPFPDATFDVVTSTFGAFTADDPYACARELARVTRPGGTIAVTAWERTGPFDVMRGVLFEHFPVLAASPRPEASAWAEAEGLTERFAGTGAELVDLDLRVFPLPFDSVEAAVGFYTEVSGPILMAKAAVEGLGGDWAQEERAIADAWRALSRPGPDGGIELLAPYGRALLAVR